MRQLPADPRPAGDFKLIIVALRYHSMANAVVLQCTRCTCKRVMSRSSENGTLRSHLHEHPTK